MTYILVIVESPAKCKKIESYLGPGYKCIASIGHLRNLLSLKDIDIENNFTPNFSIIENKRMQINKIKQLILQCKEVIIATDDDREGEAIGWHICQIFNLPIETTKRIIFHEITKTAINKAIQSPTVLNTNLINAQLGRQILDLLVGYKISPVLWKHISRKQQGLSAGRCQTPALRLIYDNYIDINKSPGSKSYNTTGYFTDKMFNFILNHIFTNEDEICDFLENSVDHDHKLTCDNPKESIRKAPQPFTTSTIQQTASNELHMSPKDTMATCQKLYEGGYITYMRTDCKIYSKEFITKAINFIISNYGDNYICKNPDLLSQSGVPKKESKKESKKETKKETIAQEAHEAIRPTHINITELPKDDDFSNKERRLYKLIWKNTIQSCMADAIFNTILAKISAPQKLEYRFTGEKIIFDGWKIIEGDKPDSDKQIAYEFLPKIKNPVINYKKIVSKFVLKDLKHHYTEAKLVQLLEQKGIGRPSTFSSLVDKIQERGYVKKQDIKGKTLNCCDFELENNEIIEIEKSKEFGNEKNKLVIQQTGLLVIEFLIEKYPDIFNYDYTRTMEDILDAIANGDKEYQTLCKKCLDQINELTPENNDRQEIKIDENHTYMIGKYGPVIKSNKNDKTEFLSIKSNIELEKLKQGKYLINDIIEEKNINRILGKYEDQDLILKKGKFGLYVTWGENKKSINDINIQDSDITINDIIKYIENNNTKENNILRIINEDLSIRKGQYGNYIFYKTKKMNKPKFLKIKDFEDDYLNCDLKQLLEWIKITYKI